MSSFSFLKDVLLKVNTDVDKAETQVLAYENNAAFYPRTAMGGGFYSQTLPQFLITVNKVERGEYYEDDFCKKLNELAYCKYFRVMNITIEGDIFNVIEKNKKVENKRYFIFDFGELIASFSAVIKRYQSEPLPREWLYSRKARLQHCFPQSLVYIVDGFGTRRNKKSVLRVKIIVKIDVQKVQLQCKVPEPVIFETVVQSEVDERIVDERIKSLMR